MKSDINQKIKHLWSIICSYSVIDRDTNNISLVNLIDTLSVTVEPTKKQEEEKKGRGWYLVPITLQLISFFRKKTRDRDVSFDTQINIINPDGKIIGVSITGTLAFPQKLVNLRARYIISGFPVDKGGTYHVQLRVRETAAKDFVEVARVPIDVNLKVQRPS